MTRPCGGESDRAARAARLRDFFELQLRFAERIAEARAWPLEQAVARFTTFHRRFGLGRIGTAPVSAEWRRYADRIRLLPTHSARLEWTLEFFVQAPEEPVSENQRFGCFSCDPPDASGLLRIHFGNRDPGGVGPLNRAKRAARTRELTELFTFVAVDYPTATTVRGTSWLYHLGAYRRLFPAAYGDSREVVGAAARYEGYSNWGQFLDHRECVKQDLRDRFLRNLATLRADRLWEVFPLPALRATAPVELFLDHYGVRR